VVARNPHARLATSLTEIGQLRFAGSGPHSSPRWRVSRTPMRLDVSSASSFRRPTDFSSTLKFRVMFCGFRSPESLLHYTWTSQAYSANLLRLASPLQLVNPPNVRPVFRIKGPLAIHLLRPSYS
jgi:hypothetical protein